MQAEYTEPAKYRGRELHVKRTSGIGSVQCICKDCKHTMHHDGVQQIECSHV